MRTVRVRIFGRVQGVGYRAWAMRAATGLGLGGWVRNRRDGTVEMLLSGAEERVAAMIEAAHRGPPAANVSKVRVDEGSEDAGLGFAARPTV